MKKLVVLGLFVFSSIYGGSFSWYQNVKVIRSKPIYKTITIQKPYRYCYNQRVAIRYDNGAEPIVAAMTGIAGGVLGHQIGKGRGKTAATIGGAVVGTLVGENLVRGRGDIVEYRNRRVCETRYRRYNKTKLMHYENIARFHGRIIKKISNHPLKFIRVKITARY